MVRWLLSMLIPVLIGSAAVTEAHPTDVCLARLVDLARHLKHCQIHQIERGQCDAGMQALEVQMSQCRRESFTEKAIENARQTGFREVKGQISRSPYRRDLRQQQWESQLMNPNLEQFQQQFPHSGLDLNDLREHFHTEACPKQYQGVEGRYLLLAEQQLSRYPELDDSQSSMDSVQALFFSQEEAGRCYAVPSLVEPGPYQLVNVPLHWIREWQKRPTVRVVYCASLDCKEEQEQVAQLYNRYQKSYRDYRHLMMCAEMDLKNAQRGRVKGKARSTIRLPDTCPTQEIDVKALNAKGEWQQLSRSLFQGVTVRIPNVKVP